VILDLVTINIVKYRNIRRQPSGFSLTDSLIDRFCNYYRIAIRSNVGDGRSLYLTWLLT